MFKLISIRNVVQFICINRENNFGTKLIQITVACFYIWLKILIWECVVCRFFMNFNLLSDKFVISVKFTFVNTASHIKAYNKNILLLKKKK